MNQTQTLARNSSLDSITRRWWFLAIFILLGTVMPPFVSRGIVEPSEIGEVISYILSNALINSWAPWYPVFKIIPLVLVAGIILFGNRMSRVFSLYAGVSMFSSRCCRASLSPMNTGWRWSLATSSRC